MATISVISGTEAPQIDETGAEEYVFNVGTRKSKLALKQTEMVLAAATNAFPKCSFVVKARDTAAGDVDKVTPFKDMAVKNIWTHDLETLMIEGQLDLLVHALKDVPTLLPPNCEVGGVLIREDPRDVLVIKAGREPCRIQDLPAGAVIGTSSIRRTAQIALKYPHLKVKDVRGNIGTRLSKLDAEDGVFDALILGAAGLLRLDLRDRIAQYLDSTNGGMLYAVGQGAIGLENRADDSRMKQVIDAVNHLPTFYAITAERSLLRTIEGGCSAPLGVEAQWEGADMLRIKAIVVSVDGKDFAEVELAEKVTNVEQAENLGRIAAAEILKRGADKILAQIKAKKPTTAADLEEK